MQCPACTRQLEAMTVSGIGVDVCRGGCGGVWFDRFELAKVDEQHEPAGEALLNIERDETITVDHARKRVCPKCEDLVMIRRLYNPALAVEVDECPGCAGMWLDHGELGAIREMFVTEEDRRTAISEHFDTLFADDLKALRAESATHHDRARNLARALRFITPSYYLPGKQKWGAF